MDIEAGNQLLQPCVLLIGSARSADRPFMKDFAAEIIADSVNPDGQRVTSFLLTYPRFVHSEIMTHRSFSRNAASSRAIPIHKVIEQVKNNPAMPVRWGLNGKGMQDHGVLTGGDAEQAKQLWINAAQSAVEEAYKLLELGLHKQVVNRLLEPFMWMTTLVTATDWENFFSLRVHKDAQPEFQHLAHMMLRGYINNQPARKQWGEWHIPFGERMPEGLPDEVKLEVATARAARTSYLTMDGQIDVLKDRDLHGKLAESGHFSPFEHPAVASPGRHANFVGWKQYRTMMPNENRKCDLSKLLRDYEASVEPVDIKIFPVGSKAYVPNTGGDVFSNVK
jgi:thymidylate synthase ThyX